MREIYVLMAIAVIGILGSCAIVNAAENIIDLGDIEYSNTHEEQKPMYINSTVYVDLRYISSDTNNESLLYIQDNWFSIIDNETTYIFVARHVSDVNWWFINDTKKVIYQDNTTGQLYSVNINYTAIQVPPDPFIEWMEKYDNLTQSSYNLTMLLNATLDELNASKNELKDKWNIFNQSQEIFDNNTIAMETMGIELHDLNIEYNKTKALWISATTNASTFETNWHTLGATHNKLQEDYDNLNGIYPIYIIFAIMGTAIIVTLFLKRKKIFGHEEPSARKNEIETGYGHDAENIDKFSAVELVKKIGEKLTPKQRRKENIIPEDKTTEPKDNTEKESIEKRLKDIETKMKTKPEE